MILKILGNGGAISNGLPYNSFIIDDYFLVETPPDIINSLFRENIDLLRINLIFISHFHADHFFGIPFLVLRLFYEKSVNKIAVYGPAKIKNQTIELCKIGFGENHPIIKWIQINIQFYEISPGRILKINDNLSIKPFSMSHFIDTYGFSFYKNGEIIFSYFADSIWTDDLINIIKQFPKVILTDMNGEPTDDPSVHISENDIINKCLPYANNKIIFYGTHLKKNKNSNNKNIKYVKPGEKIYL